MPKNPNTFSIHVRPEYVIKTLEIQKDAGSYHNEPAGRHARTLRILFAKAPAGWRCSFRNLRSVLESIALTRNISCFLSAERTAEKNELAHLVHFKERQRIH